MGNCTAIALVTGATHGIGIWTALGIARRGGTVAIVARDRGRGEATRRWLAERVPGTTIDLLVADLASMAAVRMLAAEVRESYPRLDLLINNAGVMALPKRELTADGFERQFGTNHLGHFALTGLLIPQLLAAPAPRVVTVASLAHRNGKIDFENLQSERNYKPWDAYGESKLANILFARELDRRARAAHSDLISVAVHPGISRTSIIDNGPGQKGLKSVALKVLAPLIMQPDDAGALPTLYAAISREVHGGEYIGPDGFKELKGSPVVVQPRPKALDEAVGERLWTVSEELTGVSYPPLA
jgi:NAD(P)-dependent dehydrogenase (short-subunit alcohol dehydrogenase family)